MKLKAKKKSYFLHEQLYSKLHVTIHHIFLIFMFRVLPYIILFKKKRILVAVVAQAKHERERDKSKIKRERLILAMVHGCFRGGFPWRF